MYSKDKQTRNQSKNYQNNNNNNNKSDYTNRNSQPQFQNNRANYLPKEKADKAFFDAIRSAEKKFKEEKYEEAINIYQSAKNWDSEKKTLLGTAKCYEKLGDIKNFFATLQKIKLWKEDRQAQLCLLHYYDRNQRYHEALECYYNIPESFRDGPVRKSASLVCNKLGQFQLAREILASEAFSSNEAKNAISKSAAMRKDKKFSDAINYLKKRSDSTYNKGIILEIANSYNERNFEDDNQKAKGHIQKYYSNWKKSSDALRVLLRCCKTNKEINDILEHIFALPQWKEDPQLIVAVARIHQTRNELEKAKNIYIDFLKQYPDNKKVLINLANFHKEKKEYREAIKTAQKINTWKNDKQALLIIGSSYESLEEYENSINAFSMIPCYEQTTNALIGIGRSYEKSKQYQLALNTYSKYIKIAYNKQVLWGGALCHYKLGNYEEAMTWYKKIDRYSEDSQLMCYIGDCLRQLHHFEQAMDHYQSIKNKTPSIHFSIAICHSMMRNHKQAIQIYKSYLGGKNEREAALGLAKIYDELEENDKAQYYFDQIPDIKNDRKALITYSHFLEKTGRNFQNHPLFNNEDNIVKNYIICIELSSIYVKNKKYQLAIEILKRIPDWKNKESVLYKLAKINDTIYDYKNSIAYYTHLLNIKRSPDNELSLAKAYLNTGNLEKGINILQPLSGKKCFLIKKAEILSDFGYLEDAKDAFKQIDNWHNQTDVLLGLAIACIKNDAPQEGLIHLNAIKHRQQETVLLTVARCYESLQRFDDAKNAIYEIPDWRKSKVALQTLAILLMNAHDYLSATITIKEIYDYQNNPNLYLLLAECYSHLGMDEDAYEIMNSNIVTSSDDNKIKICLGRLYENYKNYDKALEIYQSIASSNPKVLTCIAGCYAKQNKVENAINILKSISIDKSSLILLGRFYRTLGDYDNALASFHKVPNWQNNKKIQIELFRTYERKKLSGLFQVAQALVDQFPDEPTFKIMLANQYIFEKNDYDVGKKLLDDLKESYPYNIDIRLHLIRVSLMKNDASTARRYIDECKEKFQKDFKLFNKIEYLLLHKKFCSILSLDALDNDIHKAILPAPIDALYQHIKEKNSTFDISGHSVLNIIQEKDPNHSQYDIFSNHQFSIEELNKFNLNKIVHNLYKSNEGILPKVRIYREPIKRKVEDYSFTITLLQINNEKIILDPTSLGVNDAKNKILRTVIDPIVHLSSIKRILQVIEYLRCGYAPVDELERAMRNWKKTKIHDLENQEEFTNAIKEILLSKHSSEYIRILGQYGLIEELFNVSPHEINKNNFAEIALKKIESTSNENHKKRKRGNEITIDHHRKSIKSNKNSQIQQPYGIIYAPVIMTLPNAYLLEYYAAASHEHSSYLHYWHYWHFYQFFHAAQIGDLENFKFFLHFFQDEEEYLFYENEGIPFNPYAENTLSRSAVIPLTIRNIIERYAHDLVKILYRSMSETAHSMGSIEIIKEVQQEESNNKKSVSEEHIFVETKKKVKPCTDSFKNFTLDEINYLKECPKKNIKSKKGGFKGFAEYIQWLNAINALRNDDREVFINSSINLNLNSLFRVYENELPYNPYAIKQFKKIGSVELSLYQIAEVYQKKQLAYEVHKLQRNNVLNSNNNNAHIINNDNMLIDGPITLKETNKPILNYYEKSRSNNSKIEPNSKYYIHSNLTLTDINHIKKDYYWYKRSNAITVAMFHLSNRAYDECLETCKALLKNKHEENDMINYLQAESYANLTPPQQEKARSHYLKLSDWNKDVMIISKIMKTYEADPNLALIWLNGQKDIPNDFLERIASEYNKCMKNSNSQNSYYRSLR